MATHSSIHDWRNPWTEEPGGLWSMGSRRVDTTEMTEHTHMQTVQKGFPGGSAVKNPTANAGDPGSISGSGRCPGRGNGNPVQYFLLEKSHG